LTEQKKKKLIHRLRNRYRLSILNETTFEEKYSTMLSPMFVIATLIVGFIVSSFLIYLLVAFTPIKQYLIPEYDIFSKYQQDATYSRVMVDSLLKESKIKDRYIQGVKKVLKGEIQNFELSDTAEFLQEKIGDFELTPEDSILRKKLAEENKFALRDDNSISSTLENIYLFKPINGTISSDFDPSIGHFGLDLVAPKNEVVKSVLDGTVIFSTYTPEDGNIIQIQHDHNLITVYKHNSKVFKKIGDPVKAGESIAIIGNSGTQTDGPHLHFELWLKGVPTNPNQFFTFSK